MKISKSAFLILFFFYIANITLGQKLKTGPQVLSFHSEVDDTEQPYAIYIPKNFSEKKNYPLVVMLHGAGSNHRLALRRVFGKSNKEGENDVEASLYFPKWKDVEYIVVSPLARGTMGYQGIAEKDVWDMIADVKKRFKINENRTYLTGLSMGGGGTMWIGLTRPDFWAAIAPVCPAPPSGTEAFLNNASNLPVHFFQGADDPVVKAESTRKWVEDFKNVGSKVTYIEYPGVKHDSWVNAYKDGFIFTWFDKIERNPFPSKIKFSTSSLKYNKAYWLEILDKDPAKNASVEANFKDKNQLDIKTENVHALSLNILEHLNFKPKSAFRVNIDGQNLTIFGLNNGQILQKSDDKWVITKKPDYLNQKNTITQGPLIEAASGRHIYVYGTGGNPSKEVLESRRKNAELAADWSFYRGDFLGRVNVFPRVLSDAEVRPSDIERSNLFLFGDKATNSVIAKYADKFPMALKTDMSGDASLCFIYPNGKKYILVNSGLPMWEIADKNNGPFARLRSPSKIASLGAYGDWVYFDKNSNNVVNSGTFDKTWQLVEKDKTLLKNSGKVEVKP